LLAAEILAVVGGEAIGELERIVENELVVVEQVHDHRRIVDGDVDDRLLADIVQLVPAVERRREQRTQAPFEGGAALLGALAPYLGRAMALQHADELLVQMALRLDGAAGRNLDDLDAGEALHADQLDEGGGRARQLPGPALGRPRVLHAIAAMDGDVLLLHPALIGGLLHAPAGGLRRVLGLDLLRGHRPSNLCTFSNAASRSWVTNLYS